VATGLKPFDPAVIPEYNYGKLPDIITSYEFERMLLSGQILTKAGKIPKNIAIIHCVGSRNPKYHPYCSRTCCLTALKYSNQIRSALPDANIYQLYADMRAMGKGCEELYTRTSRQGVMFLMFDQKRNLPRVRKADTHDNCSMVIEMNELLSAETVEVPADLVILMVNMEAHDDSADVAHAVGVSKCGNDFYIEKHPKLDPVATTTEGIYIAGACAAPKDVPDTVAQARAAAARILGRIAKGRIEIQGVFAEVDEQACSGCRMCNELCPYSAIDFCPETRCSRIIPAACKACGACVAACPSGAITGRHFTTGQILAQLEGVLG